MRDHGVQSRRTQIDGEHLAAHEIALDARRAAPFDAELAPHDAAGTVGADQIARHDIPGAPPSTGRTVAATAAPVSLNSVSVQP